MGSSHKHGKSTLRGGIVGSACALACAERGLRVVLVEKDVLGSGATAAGMGHIVVMDDSDAQFQLTRYSQELWHKLAPRLPSSSEYEQRGTLWIAADKEELEAAEQKFALYSERSVPCRMLTSAEFANAEPNLAPRVAGALLVEEDGVVYPPTAALHLARQAEALGASVTIGNAVSETGQGRLVLNNGTEVHAERLVLAMGAASTDLRADLPVRKRKGHLLITDRCRGIGHHHRRHSGRGPAGGGRSP